MSATTVTPEWISEAVNQARNVCKASPPRERSGIQNLLRFAQSHESVAEVRLFIEYQGARAKDEGQPFFEKLAKTLDEIAGTDIERARHFLGYVVRAHRVATSTANPPPKHAASPGAPTDRGKRR
jgi:hypothetical protein